MAKHERDRVAVESSKGTHGGNRGGDREDNGRQWSDSKAGKDPHRGGRPAPASEQPR